MEKQTKESLAVELARIRDSHSGWVSGDERRRKEFAKAFSWYQERSAYKPERELLLPSWEQIFIPRSIVFQVQRGVVSYTQRFWRRKK